MLPLAAGCVHSFAPSLSQPGTLPSCPRGPGYANSLSAVTSMLVKEKSEEDPMNCLLCQSGQGHKTYGPHFS